MTKKIIICLLLITAGVMILSACKPSTPQSVQGSTAIAAVTEAPTTQVRNNTLTYLYVATPASLDPADGEPGSDYFFSLAYDSLVKFDYDGTYKPLLATSWKWVGSDYKTLDMEIRHGVKFSDGTQFTASVVKGWMDLQKANQSTVARTVPFESVEVTGPLSMRLHLVDPNPRLPLYLSRIWFVGMIPCEAGINNPEILKTDTCGAGPYMLDEATTVMGDHYTYIPNPYYWNPETVYWNKVVIKVVVTPQAKLDALRAGDAQVYGPADPSIIDNALSSGLAEVSAEQQVMGFDILDKSGAIVPALGDVRVRKALNYAIDRDALTKALGTPGSRPTSTEFLPGSEGYDSKYDNYYPYDVEKAKQLLADAGYADGFTMAVLSFPRSGGDAMSELVASYWKDIGVNLEIDSKATISDWWDGLTSSTYPIAVAPLGGTTPILTIWSCCYAPGALWNSDKTRVPELEILIDRIRVTDLSEVPALARQVNAYITENAWFVPVFTERLHYLYDPTKVTVPEVSGMQPVLNIADIRPAE